ncbi:alginate lyase [Paenibacillus methanolicus]|uniref:Alginate lyase n=2 Tax=Paenibacillus methanolicus TaxID=582686 RepID=A0A5S5CA13_9BACL|nr:alginate lyase [Paenibacillus methanolicus]
MKDRLREVRERIGSPAFEAASGALRAEAEALLRSEYRIAPRERGGWAHHYYCPDDASRLTFDWNRPDEHVCLRCGISRRGEPYDGAWISLAHGRLGAGLKSAALLGTALGEERLLAKARELLLAYAAVYIGFEPHGGIPYNGPGKLFQQTLDEAHWILDVCQAYLWLRDRLAADDRQRIAEGVLRPCAEFLAAHKERQLHNHAMLITAAIGMLGFALDDERLTACGLQGEYGLFDQLTRGVLEDGLWYEGAFHYHYYALHPVLQYGLAVEGTPWDIRMHPSIKRMFDSPLDYIGPDGVFPSLNDASSIAAIGSFAPYYEIAHDWYGEPVYADYLRLAYGIGDGEEAGGPYVPVPRSSVYSLLCGADLTVSKDGERAGGMPPGRSMRERMRASRSSAGSGLTKLVNARSWQLIVKHSPFSGEHDHMDRLGLSLRRGTESLLADPGTTAYGVPIHYGWLKHTYSHQTVALDGKDQPPADGRRLGWGRETWGEWVASAVDWTEPGYRMKPDIILPPELCPWDAEAYRDASVVRVNALLGDAFLDIVRVRVPDQRTIDLLYHIDGELSRPAGAGDASFAGVFCELDSTLFESPLLLGDEGQTELRWELASGHWLQGSWCSREVRRICARTPGNPPDTRRQSLVQRVNIAGEATFVNLFRYSETNAWAQTSAVRVAEADTPGRLIVQFAADGEERRFIVRLSDMEASMRLEEERD